MGFQGVALLLGLFTKEYTLNVVLLNGAELPT